MKNSRKRFTQSLFLGVAILGLFSSVLLLSDPPAANSEDAPATSSLFSLNSAVLNRSIASVTAAAMGPANDILLNLSCGELNQSLETASSRFRLRGDNCTSESDKASPINTQVKNKSNGYVATVFHGSPQTFTTDYINLNEGKNEITVTFEAEGRSVEKTLTITRHPTTAKN